MQNDMRERLIALIKEVPYGVSVGATFERHFCEKVTDHLIANGVILPPCKVGDTIYKIVKFCDENTGYKEFYKPTKEFDTPCTHYIPAEWEIEECCEIGEDGYCCSLYLDMRCEMCRDRIAIQKDKFQYSMMNKIYNTAMFDKNTKLEDMYFLTLEEAVNKLKEIQK